MTEGGYHNINDYYKSHLLGVLDFCTGITGSFIDSIIRCHIRTNERIMNSEIVMDLDINSPLGNRRFDPFYISHFSHRSGTKESSNNLTIGKAMIDEISPDDEVVDIYSWLPYPKHQATIRKYGKKPLISYRLFGIKRAY